MHHPLLVHPQILGRSAVEHSNKWQCLRSSNTEWRPSTIARLETTSYELIPSTETNVVSGLISHNAWRLCATHSQPALVENAYSNVDVAASTTLLNCCAMVRAVNVLPVDDRLHVEMCVQKRAQMLRGHPTRTSRCPALCRPQILPQHFVVQIEWWGTQLHQCMQEGFVREVVLVFDETPATNCRFQEQGMLFQRPDGLTRVRPTTNVCAFANLFSMAVCLFPRRDQCPPPQHIACCLQQRQPLSLGESNKHLPQLRFADQPTSGLPEQEQSWEQYEQFPSSFLSHFITSNSHLFKAMRNVLLNGLLMHRGMLCNDNRSLGEHVHQIHVMQKSQSFPDHCWYNCWMNNIFNPRNAYNPKKSRLGPNKRTNC